MTRPAVGFLALTPRLPVADLGATRAFYERVLGFRPEVLWPDDGPTFAILVRGGASVSFFSGDRAGPEHRGYAELYVEVDDAAALAESLRAHVPIEWGPEVYAYGRREFAVLDPDGYMVIFTESTHDPPTTSEPG